MMFCSDDDDDDVVLDGGFGMTTTLYIPDE
jgi:hypothetical protein